MFEMLIGMLVQYNIWVDFQVWDGYKRKGRWIIELRENEDKIPKELAKDKVEVVLDGFCNPVEMLSFVFSLEPVHWSQKQLKLCNIVRLALAFRNIFHDKLHKLVKLNCLICRKVFNCMNFSFNNKSEACNSLVV